ncbi:LOW QUALITY PROTEIN: hypothetical protein T265_14504 [Opisthorchis viverrini]|uniref:Uncharacterized protein n=1 Tax=Opisthorchis viverrini TaxID=6198 RepID=A0A075A939_OPIVI|nr:LOW QUALITY PROTEIN: hypothetical protein T265_14504 [Opisthorchis viverrini]KER24039.1 LOW QUALITY PROTEIN: hypothetical protein T265_14504 [Opisthorchis viverrini]
MINREQLSEKMKQFSHVGTVPESPSTLCRELSKNFQQPYDQCNTNIHISRYHEYRSNSNMRQPVAAHSVAWKNHRREIQLGSSTIVRNGLKQAHTSMQHPQLSKIMDAWVKLVCSSLLVRKHSVYDPVFAGSLRFSDSVPIGQFWNILRNLHNPVNAILSHHSRFEQSSSCPGAIIHVNPNQRGKALDSSFALSSSAVHIQRSCRRLNSGHLTCEANVLPRFHQRTLDVVSMMCRAHLSHRSSENTFTRSDVSIQMRPTCAGGIVVTRLPRMSGVRYGHWIYTADEL